MSTTVVLSDLHLGGRSGADVLRRPEHRGRLLEALDGADRVVLLGDVLELRHGPPLEALRRATDALRAIGDAAAGAELLVVAGNHDHLLVGPWLEGRMRDGTAPPLGLEHRLAPKEGGWLAEGLADALGHGDLALAFPGVWLRDDVYATHGHFLDLWSTVPTFERLGAAVTGRIVGPLPDSLTPDDVLARLEPIYGWVDAVARHAPPDRLSAGAGGAAKAYEMLSGSGPRPLRSRLLAGVFPLAVAAINRAGLGPVSADLGGEELRRASLRAMDEVIGRLGIDAEHVIFGHSHRAGPLPGDRQAEWVTPTGARLHNTGCWVFETHFLAGPDGSSPYWPGGVQRLGTSGPPKLDRLLADVPADRLRPRELAIRPPEPGPA